ncbi:methyltransferase domain-containing protein [Nocardioides jiangxiensis]|uniref:Methyltransferase domain-containing protein n=1 Tax=Nocardioides jiangxiensis TaxID=3064524 RepID=A0ABT9B223_9ACTN|nr:methyltransferase domain-containing protein [Nocardioides sp. WY-20]MDO7868777.1 methyltransferase domain-containing protein [Nocardioides sp. WY-20]
MTLQVDADGLTVAGAELLSVPLQVSFDGAWVWSTTPARDGVRRSGGGLVVPWPPALASFLDGRARVQVSRTDGSVVHDAELVLGSGEGRIRVVDASGHPLSIDKVGHLTRSFAETSADVREEILAGTGRALADLRERAGVEAYLNYGALLGAVRDGRMLGHDSDTDVCYLSGFSDPVDVIRESYRVERVMRDLGWDVLRMSGGDIKLLLPLSDGRVCHIDVFVAFHTVGRFFQLGNRSGQLPRESILPVSTIVLQGHAFPAPADPEAMLAFVYGPGWRVPDPSFRYADPPAGIRRLDGWLRGFRTEMPAWSEHHLERVGQWETPSEFGQVVAGRLPADALVVDLGAGRGRDALHFARRGHEVRAYDFSRPAIHAIRRRARRSGLPVTPQRLILDELRFVASVGAQLSRLRPELYSRQLVGCLTPHARGHLWRLARMATAEGGTFHLEYAATGPGRLPAPEPDGLVRRLDPDLVAREVAASGGVIDDQQLLATGEDPRVARLRVRWPRGVRDLSDLTVLEEESHVRAH